MPEPLAALVPAAGLASRFGADKLLARFAGKPLAAHIADTLAGMKLRHRIAICPRGNGARAELFAARGFEIVWNDAPELGLGRSLALGAARAQALDVAGVLVCLADMPNVSRAHLEHLLAAGNGGNAVATEIEGRRMPPALFPRASLANLAALTGDHGARRLLALAQTVDADPALARDVDTPADLDRLG